MGILLFFILMVYYQTGKIADELEYVGHHIRSKLDELKRQELNRLRDIANKAYSTSDPGHVDHENPHSFEKADLLKLIQQVCIIKYLIYHSLYQDLE